MSEQPVCGHLAPLARTFSGPLGMPRLVPILTIPVDTAGIPVYSTSVSLEIYTKGKLVSTSTPLPLTEMSSFSFTGQMDR